MDPDEDPGLAERTRWFEELAATARAEGHGEPDSGSAVQELAAYGFLVLVLLAAYIGWVLASAWLVLKVLSIDQISGSNWYPTVAAAALVPIAAAALIPILAFALRMRIDRLYWIPPSIVGLGPAIVSFVAFGVLDIR
jgi:hypothetical protein